MKSGVAKIEKNERAPKPKGADINTGNQPKSTQSPCRTEGGEGGGNFDAQESKEGRPRRSGQPRKEFTTAEREQHSLGKKRIVEKKGECQEQKIKAWWRGETRHKITNQRRGFEGASTIAKQLWLSSGTDTPRVGTLHQVVPKWEGSLTGKTDEAVVMGGGNKGKIENRNGRQKGENGIRQEGDKSGLIRS